jgi:small-conductance mechanosensitive channel
MGTFAILSPLQKDGLIATAILVAVACLAIIAKHAVFAFMGRVAARRTDGVPAAVLRRAAAPCEFIFPLSAIELALPAVTLPEWIKTPFERILGLCIIAAIAWVLVTLIELATDLSKRRYRLDAEDNLRARQAETRLDILNRTGVTIVAIVAVALMLMTFPAIRTIGATLLASAGLLGIGAGIAARPFFENVVAGLQIALTQPIRIDDVVIVETEYGRVEKITSTYVVLRLWDWRRMIVPLTYFINTPFQNWTYNTANLIGSIMLYLDYSVPLDDVRGEVERILDATPLWDKAVKNVAMTDAGKEGIVEVRVLVSARDSATLFDLRCLVRERLVAFIQERHPGAFPSTRIDLGDAAVPVAPVPAGARG